MADGLRGRRGVKRHITNIESIPNEQGGAFFFPRPNVSEAREEDEEDDCTAVALRDCGRDEE